MTATVGELKGIKDNMEIEWRIIDFFTLSETKYNSPVFHFAGASWILRIYPNGSVKNETVGNVDCFLRMHGSGCSDTLTYELGLKTVDGNIDKECSYSKTFVEDVGFGCSKVVSRSELLSRVPELAPSNILTIICKLRKNEPFILSSPLFQRTEKLSKDLKNLMLNGNGSDLTVRLKEKEFKLHKIILGIRSPAFATMVKKELDNKIVDVVDIHDCEEGVFNMFLEYAYTGTITVLVEKLLFGLYEIAGKYEVAELKEDCLKRIKDTLSVDTFFDAVELSEIYDEKELKLLVSKFCSDNLKDLVNNQKWMTFMEENTKKAYELLSMSLTNYVKS